MSEKTKSGGPSNVGMVAGIISVAVCMALVAAIKSGLAGFLVVLALAVIVCPWIMTLGGKNFWDYKIDWATGLLGAGWWFIGAIALQMNYPLMVWVFGLSLAMFTAVIIGKMARSIPIGGMAIMGFVLGLIVIWMNNWAIHGHAVLAVDTSHFGIGGYILAVSAVSIAVISITLVARKRYHDTN